MIEDALPQPVSPYGVTKLSAEQLCHLYHVNYRVPAVSMRYFTVYGPRQRPDMGFHRFFLAAMRDEPVTVFGDGRQTRDFTFVGDAVAATVAASTRGTPGAVYNIGGGSRVELLDVFELIGRVTGRPLRLNRSSRRPATCATPTPTPRAHAPTLRSRPAVRSSRDFARSFSG